MFGFFLEVRVELNGPGNFFGLTCTDACVYAYVRSSEQRYFLMNFQ